MRVLFSIIACLALANAAAAQPAAAQAPVPETPPADTRPAEIAEVKRGPVEMITIFGEADDLSGIGGSAHVIDQETLENMEYDDIHRVLREVPGVYVREEDGFGLRPNIGIRGASSDRSAKVTLMEDGVLFAPAPYSAPAAYYFPLITRMVGVEVFKGPASIEYGPHTVGGAINLVTRPIPDEAIAAIDLAYGQFDTFKLHSWGGARGNGFGLLLEGVRIGSDGFKDLDGGGNTGFERNELMLKGDYTWPWVSQLDLVTEIKVGYSDELSHETYLGLSDDDFDKTPYRRYPSSALGRMEWEREQFQLSQFVGVSDELRFQFTAYRNQLERAWRKLNRFEQGAPSLNDIFRDPTGVNAVFLSVLRGDSDSAGPLETLLIGTNDRSFVSQGLQLVGNWDQPTGPLDHFIEGGVRLHYDEIDRDHTEDPYVMRSAMLERTDAPRRQIVDSLGEALALAVYVRDEIEWGRLTVAPGLRFESIWTDFTDRLPETEGLPDETDSDQQSIIIPGISAVYSLTDELDVLGGVHRGFSPVAPGQSGSADPEDSINYEAGLRYLGPYFNAFAIGFFNDYDNLLATCRQGTGCDPEDIDKQFNGGDVDVYGLELTADAEPELGWEVYAPLSVTYTLTQSEFRSTFSSASAIFGDVEKGDELPYVPEHQAFASVGLRRGPIGVTTTVAYVGEQRDVAGQGSIPENERIDAYVVADLTVYWDFSDNGRLYLGIDNFTDEAYIVSRRPFGARPGLPFQVMGGIKYQLGG